MADDTERESSAEEGQNGSGDGGSGLLSSLMSKEVLIPAAATAGAAVIYAAAKGASSAKDEAEDEAGDLAENVGRRGIEGAKSGLANGGIAGKLASKFLGGAGGGGAGKAKKTRRLPIQRWTDVAVPVETAYEKWTDFESFPKFMHRVLNVKQEDDDKVQWQEKIGFSKRQWEAEITDRRENDRVAWKTTSGMAHAGIVSFHRLDDNLTRIMVTVDFVPQGTMEKMASGLRFVKRAIQADLARFKAYVEMGDAEEMEYKARPAEQGATERGEDEESGAQQDGQSAQANGSDPSADEEGRKERDQRRRDRRKATATR